MIGSSTGNYLSGHGETLEQKASELRKHGLFPVAELKQWGHLEPSWGNPGETR